MIEAIVDDMFDELLQDADGQVANLPRCEQTRVAALIMEKRNRIVRRCSQLVDGGMELNRAMKIALDDSE